MLVEHNSTDLDVEGEALAVGEGSVMGTRGATAVALGGRGALEVPAVMPAVMGFVLPPLLSLLAGREVFVCDSPGGVLVLGGETRRLMRSEGCARRAWA